MLGFHPTHINIHVGAKAGRSQPRSKALSPTGRVGENPENKVEKITLIVHCMGLPTKSCLVVWDR